MATGTVPDSDALRQPLRDRRLADAGRADERRVVLALPQEDVDRAGDLLVATADHLEASGARVGGEVAREARQRPGIGAFGTKGIVDHAVCADAEVRGCVRALKGAPERGRRKERASPTHGFQMVHTGVRGRCRRGFLPHASRGGADQGVRKTRPRSRSPQSSITAAAGARNTPNGTSGSRSDCWPASSGSSVCVVARPRRSTAIG